MADKKIKIGVIGCGGISGIHLLSYSKCPDAEIYALCDINPENLNRRAEEYHVERLYSDYREMVKLEELDAVSVCTWNSAHAECAIAALEAGKHVICEKPMALNAEQAEKMLAASKKAGKLLMIGFVRRFGADCEVLKDFIDNGYFGDIYYAKASYLRRKGCPGGWFGDKSRSGGGPLIDLGVHVIDLCRYLMGRAKPVSAYGATFDKLGAKNDVKAKADYESNSRGQTDIFDVEDLATAMVRFDNGAVLHIDASFTLNIDAGCGTIQLFGSKAGAKLDPGLTIATDMNSYLANVQLAADVNQNFATIFEKEIAHFVACVRDGIPCRNPAEDGVALMKILDAIYKSAATGHEVVIE